MNNTAQKRSEKQGLESTESREIAQIMAAAAQDLKAQDIAILKMDDVSSFTDYFVIASGRSDRQVQAIADHIREILSQYKSRPIGVEGYQKGHWILMDYGFVVVHVFLEDVRSFYGIEQFWGDATRIVPNQTTISR